MSDYIIRKQRRWQEKQQREADEKAKREAEREAELAAEALKRKEAAERKKLLQEQQEAERLRLQRLQEKEKLDAKRMSKQVDTLISILESDQRQRENVRLQEIQIIIQNREPHFGVLDWHTWLSSPHNQRLAELDLELAMELFKRDNLLAKRRHGTRGKKAASKPFVLTFAGSSATDYVSTIFNPDDYDGTGTGLNHGFTISYWVKPAQIGGTLKALGRRSETDGRWEFGIKSADDVHVGVGATVKDDNDFNGDVETGHGMTVGNWYHWVVTYGGDDAVAIGGDRFVRIWINGKEIYKDGAASGTGNENGMGTANWREGNTNTVNAASNLYFGARAAFQDLDTPYNQGWACSLSEIAIYKEEKDEDGTFANQVYNAGFGYDHRNNSNLVGYWRLNEGSGTTVEDLSRFGNHGTLTTDGTEIPTWTKNGSYE